MHAVWTIQLYSTTSRKREWMESSVRDGGRERERERLLKVERGRERERETTKGGEREAKGCE